METDRKCWGEQQGLQGCAACDLKWDWLRFLQGGGLNERCRAKMERQFGKETVKALESGEAQFDPGSAIDSWSRGLI